METVFVYGTLQKEFGNHRVMQDAGGKFIAKAHTMDRYPLLVDGLPFLIDQVGLGEYVICELYDVRCEGLRIFDRLEGHPSFYERRVRTFLCDRTEEMTDYNSRKKTAWVYFLNSHLPPTLDRNFYKSYRQGRDCRDKRFAHQH